MENYIKMYEAIEKVIPILEKEGYKINDPWRLLRQKLQNTPVANMQ